MKPTIERVEANLRETRRRIVNASVTPDHYVTELFSVLVIAVFLYLTMLAAVVIVLSPLLLLLWFSDVAGLGMLVATLALPALLLFVLAVGYYYQS